MEALEQVELAGAHHRRLVGLGVIVSQYVQDAVDHEQSKFVVEGAGVLGELIGGNGRTDHHIAEQRRHPVERLVVHRERQHIGRPRLAHVFRVQFGDVVTIEERGGDVRVTYTTTFCPDVGIVILEVDTGLQHERAELRSYGPPVFIGSPGTTMIEP